jgi:hypothetical protein
MGFAQLKDALMLKLSSGSYSDETAVRFLEEATDSFDPDWDAYKLSNGGNTPNFFTVVNGESYVINALKGPLTEKTVSLNLEVAFSGTYTITADEIGLFDSLCSITLIDKVLNVSHDLRTDSAYSFEFVKGDPGDRFLIEFKNDSGVVNAPQDLVSSVKLKNSSNINVYNKENKIYIEFDETTSDVSISIYDLSGRELYKEENVNNSSSISSWEFSPEVKGICMVKVLAGNKSYMGKVYIDL